MMKYIPNHILIQITSGLVFDSLLDPIEKTDQHTDFLPGETLQCDLLVPIGRGVDGCKRLFARGGQADMDEAGVSF